VRPDLERCGVSARCSSEAHWGAIAAHASHGAWGTLALLGESSMLRCTLGMEPEEHDLDDWTGRILGGQFRLERVLGRGGMGHVYVAEQLEVGRRVVIKVLNAARLADHNSEARFQREARALAQLNHPNIVHLYLFGRSDEGIPYLAMELVEGRPLASSIEEQGVASEREALEILDQICGALVEAHRRGVVHRDLKPDNVMLSARHDASSRVKILDFGIAKLVRTAADARLTQRGEVLGTPLYMAPEQVREHSADARTDIYALGVIGYELLTGDVPYAAESSLGVMLKVMNEPLVPVRERAPDAGVSPATDALISRCLEKDPAARFQTAVELRSALAKLREQLSRTQLSAAGAYERAHTPVRASVAYASTVEAEPLAVRSEAPLATLGSLSLAVDAGPEPWLTQRIRRRRLRWVVFLAVLLAAAVLGLFGPKLRQSQPSDAEPSWVQGIPFPQGTDFVRFEPLQIDARVPGNVQQTLAFYHRHLDAKWGGARSLPQGLEFADPHAPVAQLSVAPLRKGSRVVITRRASEP
jgi:serine/threonine protein kinase